MGDDPIIAGPVAGFNPFGGGLEAFVRGWPRKIGASLRFFDCEQCGEPHI